MHIEYCYHQFISFVAKVNLFTFYAHQVSQEAFDSCDVSSVPLYTWGSPSVDNSVTIPHLSPRTYYFLCTVSGHCDAGMKLQVEVLPSDGLPVFTLPVSAICLSSHCAFSYSVETTPQLFAVMVRVYASTNTALCNCID